MNTWTMVKLICWMAVLALAILMLPAGPEAAADDPMYVVGSPVAITGPDADARDPVTLKNAEGQSVCTMRGQEAEVSLAADPGDPQRLVAAWMQNVAEGASSGGIANVVGYSTDGGEHWSRTGVRGMSHCTGTDAGQADFNLDPSVAIGIDGISYLSSIGNHDIVFNDLQAHRSEAEDGGSKWSDVMKIDTTNVNDFPQVTADPTLAGHAYIVWLGGAEGIFMARTKDGGENWTKDPLPIAPPSLAQLVVLRDQTPSPPLCSASCRMVLVFTVGGRGNQDPTEVFTIRSTNGGRTWSSPVAASGVLPRKAVPRAAAALDDTIYVSWWNGGKAEIVRSTDHGQTWSAPATVSDAKGTSTVFQGPGPAVAVDASGTVGVLWYDSRNDTDKADPSIPSDVWFAYSRDRGASGT